MRGKVARQLRKYADGRLIEHEIKYGPQGKKIKIQVSFYRRIKKLYKQNKLLKEQRAKGRF